MNKKYCVISFFIFIILIMLVVILFESDSVSYVTMTSIFVPILFGFIIDFDKKQKERYRLYYLPLYNFIKTYYDILSQPYDRINMGKKHEMMSDISKDLLTFLNSNLNYASEEISNELSVILFYRYENKKVANEFQDVYNINRLIPIITKELVENYNVLHINHYIFRKKYLHEKYHMVNGIIFMYVDSFLLDIARKKEYAISLFECVEYYNKINKFRIDNFEKYYEIYKYIKKNRNKDVNLLKKELKNKFGIKINKLKK